MNTKKGGGQPLYGFWIAAAVILGVSGLIGCLDRYVHWGPAFGELNKINQQIFQAPIASVIGGVCPSSWCSDPGWLASYFVLCTAVFLLVDTSWRSNMGQTLILDAFRDSGPIGGPIFLLAMFILTPIFLPLSFLVQESLSHEGKTQVRIQLRYYGLMLTIVAIMAVVNYGLYSA